MLLAVLIVITASIYFYSQNLKNKELESEAINSINTPVDLIPIRGYFENCVRDIANEAVLLAGYQGGLVKLMPGFPVLKTSFSDIHYYKFEESKLIWPDFENLAANQINEYINDNIANCVDDAKKRFLQITYGENPSAKTSMEKDYLRVGIDYPISLTIGKKTVSLEKFKVKIPVRLGLIIDSARKIAQRQIADVDSIDLNYLSQFDFSVSPIITKNQDIIYKIVDRKSIINDEPYVFLFAEKYNLKNNGNNYAPRLDFIKDVKLKVGDKFSFKATASDINADKLKFSSSSDIFKISEDGLIDFTPKKEDLGYHFATVTVKDGKNLSNSRIFRIEVI